METPFDVFIRHGLINNMNSLQYQDLCTIQCVSKETYYTVQHYINLNKNQLLYQELGNFTNHHANFKKEHLLDLKMLIKYLVCIRRYYKKDDTKMTFYMQPLTISSLSMFFTNLKSTLNEQICTINVLLNCHQHCNVEQNIFICTLIYYFITQILNNHKNDLKNKKVCLLAYRRFVSTAKNKVCQLQDELRIQVLGFPMCFVDRIKRIFSEAKTKLIKLKHFEH
jgi:hypothetical protein